MARPACVFAMVLLTAPARSAFATPGFGLALGAQAAPGVACRVEALAGGCDGSAIAWAARGQVAYALADRWTAGLVLGFGTDLDFLEVTTDQGGHAEDGRQFVDLMARARYLLGDSGWGWVGIEAGAALARDWVATHDRDGRRTATVSARQYGPSVGALAGFRLGGNKWLALDAEIGARLTAWGHDPPPLPGAPATDGPARATEYGRAAFLWVGLGLRFGR
jgi:hypothetical protein